MYFLCLFCIQVQTVIILHHIPVKNCIDLAHTVFRNGLVLAILYCQSIYYEWKDCMVADRRFVTHPWLCWWLVVLVTCFEHLKEMISFLEGVLSTHAYEWSVSMLTPGPQIQFLVSPTFTEMRMSHVWNMREETTGTWWPLDTDSIELLIASVHITGKWLRVFLDSDDQSFSFGTVLIQSSWRNTTGM